MKTNKNYTNKYKTLKQINNELYDKVSEGQSSKEISNSFFYYFKLKYR